MMLLPEKYRYIVIEGAIGVGKTSLARLIAERSGASVLLENPGANPFLPGFYQDSARYALPTQMFFLFQRLDQLRELTQTDLFKRSTISDFILDKDPLFARLTLNDDELRLYQQMYDQLRPVSATPDLVIYLQAPVESLLERIKRRGIGYEKTISEEYLLKLTDSYARFFYQYEAAPVLTVNSRNLNFIDSSDDFELLLQRIRAMRSNREFFNLGE